MDKRNLIRYIFTIIVVIFAFPFNLWILTGFTNWFSPFLMLNSVFSLKSLVILNIIGFFVLIAIWFRSRWFCNYLCPLGLIQDIVSKAGKIKTSISASNVPVLNEWFVAVSLGGALLGFPVFILFDPLTIFNGFFISLIPPFEYIALSASIILPLILISTILVPGLWCKKICPLGGLQQIVSKLKNLIYKPVVAKEIDIGRRLFIGGMIGITAGLVLPDLTGKSSKTSIRPPGSIETKYFDILCTRCGSCIKVCPTKILKHETRLGMGLLTPVVYFSNGYCLEKCNSCGIVCPSGAITRFTVDVKSTLKIAKPVFNADNCLLTKMEECGICKKACPYGVITIIDYEVSSLQMVPVINYTDCNGCGACSVICPEKCFEMQPVFF